MDKPIEFGSLFELIKNFDEAYKELGHKLLKVISEEELSLKKQIK